MTTFRDMGCGMASANNAAATAREVRQQPGSFARWHVGGGDLWRIGGAALALLLLWQAAAGFSEGRRMAPLAAYVHAAWWQAGEQTDPVALLAEPPGRADGRAWSAYGQVALAAARQRSQAAAGHRDLEVAERATRRALALGPAQAAAWARLALIAVNRGDARMAAAALGRSLALAPNAPALAWLRSKLGLYLWDGLRQAERVGVRHDLARVWRQPPSEALPYPRQALQRYAASLGQSELLVALLVEAGGDAG